MCLCRIHARSSYTHVIMSNKHTRSSYTHVLMSMLPNFYFVYHSSKQFFIYLCIHGMNTPSSEGSLAFVRCSMWMLILYQNPTRRRHHHRHRRRRRHSIPKFNKLTTANKSHPGRGREGQGQGRGRDRHPGRGVFRGFGQHLFGQEKNQPIWKNRKTYRAYI